MQLFPISLDLFQARERVAEVLRRDLPRQYEHPLKLDFSIFHKNITFDDPMTNISGLNMYKV